MIKALLAASRPRSWRRRDGCVVAAMWRRVLAPSSPLSAIVCVAVMSMGGCRSTFLPLRTTSQSW